MAHESPPNKEGARPANIQYAQPGQLERFRYRIPVIRPGVDLKPDRIAALAFFPKTREFRALLEKVRVRPIQIAQLLGVAGAGHLLKPVGVRLALEQRQLRRNIGIGQ